MPALSKKQQRFQCRFCGVSSWRANSLCLRCYKFLRSATKLTREDRLRYMKGWHASIKNEVFQAYGGYVCACCGEKEKTFLVIDHVGGGGNAERRIGRTRGGAGQYWMIRKAGFPAMKYQVLCHNCNFAKSVGGCPHAIHQ